MGPRSASDPQKGSKLPPHTLYSPEHAPEPNMEKSHVAAGGSFCGVRRRPKLLGVFTV